MKGSGSRALGFWVDEGLGFRVEGLDQDASPENPGPIVGRWVEGVRF